MKIHTTNYKDTLIQVADDCPVAFGEVPPTKGDTKMVAVIQFEILSRNPYTFTSDDVLFHVYALRNNLTEKERKQERAAFFSKGQPCFRSSPLTKRYGWGIHSDKDGKIALLGCETAAYKALSEEKKLKVVKAMRSRK